MKVKPTPPYQIGNEVYIIIGNEDGCEIKEGQIQSYSFAPNCHEPWSFSVTGGFFRHPDQIYTTFDLALCELLKLGTIIEERKPEFKIGDIIWVYRSPTFIGQYKISKVVIEAKRIYYEFFNAPSPSYTVKEDCCFSTVEELIKSKGIK
jgi:hypothetical protein